jgi:hypothetical protein
MLDLIKALLALRLGVVFVFVMAGLALLGVWSIGHGSVAAGVLVLAAVAVSTGAVATLLAHSGLGRK